MSLSIFKSVAVTAVAVAVGPDLTKFYHFGTMLKHFGHFRGVHLVFAKLLSLFWQI